MSLQLKGLSKAFESGGAATRVLREVDLSVSDGEMTVVVGPSGSGKTTLLRCIAGLERPDEGTVEVAGSDVTLLPPGRRDIAMVFQDYALYPHLTVRDNIAFGLKARKTPAAEAERAVASAAALVGLTDVLHRAPGQLSGGERQRVALARALVRKPAAFLLDEPLSNLDAELRAQTRTEIRALQRSLGTTTVYVTHDQVEAMTMGDQVAVLRAGRVEQVGSPMELYERPANSFVARFLGSPPMNLAPGGLWGLGDGVVGGVRPERLAVVGSGTGNLDGTVVAVEPIGGEAIVHVAVEGERLLVRRDLRSSPREGEPVGLAFERGDLHAFDADGARIQ